MCIIFFNHFTKQADGSSKFGLGFGFDRFWDRMDFCYNIFHVLRK